MDTRNLLEDPIHSETDLGKPIPESPHAVSVALPRWQDVVGYEEGRPEVIGRLAGGYPRFVVHPFVRRLAQDVGDEKPCLPFPSKRVAEMCSDFVRRSSGEVAEIVARSGVFGVRTTEVGHLFVKAFWQHTGLIVSSRQAEAILTGRRDGADGVAVLRSLRRQLADVYDCAPDDVFLTPSGMAAQFAALQAVRSRRPGQPTVQLGFPYVDTLKLQQKFGDGGILLHDLERLANDLRDLLGRQSLAAGFCEIPGNPLLGSADLRTIGPLLRARRVPLVVDDVVATPWNVNLEPYADLVATSLTKYAVGTGDAMGGALIANPRSPLYDELQPLIRAQHEELLWAEDAAVIDAHVGTFEERVRRHNQNGRVVAERLRCHPDVERVWYPAWEHREAYEAVRRPDGGYGSLIAFVPKQAETRAAHVYDALAVCKGPSLGTMFTLACPFTLLAHYGELDWAESCGISRHLIRISVGLEDAEALWGRLDTALRVP